MINPLKYSLNGNEMKFLNPDAKIIKYTELYNFKTIEQLFKKLKTNKIIILYLLHSSFYGHWTTLFYNPTDKTYNFFDSYGKPYDYHLDNLSKEKRKELNEQKNYLYNLLKKHKVYYNNIIYQIPNTETCGMWITHRLHNYKLSDYEYLMFFLKNDINDPDLFVSNYTLKLLSKY